MMKVQGRHPWSIRSNRNTVVIGIIFVGYGCTEGFPDAYLPIQAAISFFMDACDQAPLILLKMQVQISLTLCWRSADALLTLIFRMWLGAWVCLFCTSRRLRCRKWTVTYQHQQKLKWHSQYSEHFEIQVHLFSILRCTLAGNVLSKIVFISLRDFQTWYSIPKGV